MCRNALLVLTSLTILFLNDGCKKKMNNDPDPIDDNYWPKDKIEEYSLKYNIHNYGPEKYHFPGKSYLKSGYHPEGGYVKDFSIFYHENRWHVFHIDGRPGETCWITGNEISFGHASTNDFKHWIRHNLPLTVGHQDWENSHIWAPFVYKSDSTFYMFYTAKGTSGNSNIAIATSENLEQWKKKGSPIAEAPGRDAFVFENDGQTILFYTYGNKIGASSSKDLKTWSKLNDVIEIPHGAPESCSVYKVKDKYLLWFNGWNIFQDSKMHAFYSFSDSILDFNNSTYKQFDFITDPTHTRINDSFIVKPHNICPISIEKIGGTDSLLFVSYFRPQEDRYKLFFAEMDVTKDPIAIREINSNDELKKLLDKVNISMESIDN